MCYGLIWADSQLSRTHTPYAWDPAPAAPRGAGVQAAARAARGPPRAHAPGDRGACA